MSKNYIKTKNQSDNHSEDDTNTISVAIIDRGIVFQ